LTFEPDPDYSPDAGTGFLLRYRVSAATRNFITSGKSHVYVSAARCCSEADFKTVLFTAMGTPLSEVRALYRVPFVILSFVLSLILLAG